VTKSKQVVRWIGALLARVWAALRREGPRAIRGIDDALLAFARWVGPALVRLEGRVDWRRVWASAWVVLIAAVVGVAGWWFPEVFPEYVANNRADRWIGWLNITNLSASVALLLIRTLPKDWTWLVRAIVWVFSGLICLYLVIVAPHEGWSFFVTPNWVWLLRFEVAWGALVYTLALITGEVTGLIDRRWQGRLRRRMPDQLTPDVILATIAEAKPIIIADGTGRIVYATNSITEVAGGPVEGLNVAALVPLRLRDRHLAGMDRFTRTGEGSLIGRVVEAPLLRRDGAETRVHLALSVADVGSRRFIIASVFPVDNEIVLA
jgi:PAS domain-containing protein